MDLSNAVKSCCVAPKHLDMKTSSCSLRPTELTSGNIFSTIAFIRAQLVMLASSRCTGIVVGKRTKALAASVTRWRQNTSFSPSRRWNPDTTTRSGPNSRVSPEIAKHTFSYYSSVNPFRSTSSQGVSFISLTVTRERSIAREEMAVN